MNNLYDKIYEAIDSGIQKALIINNDQSQDASIKFHNKEISTEFIPYEYRTIDLELPSGLLWCEYNLGAFPGSIPKNWIGNYYSWGEVETKRNYSQETYQYYVKATELSKYNINPNFGDVDNLSILEPIDDAANIVLGKQYRMPTKDDFDELIKYTRREYVTNYCNITGLNGWILTSKINSKVLFLPCTGFYDSSISYYTEIECSLWTSSAVYEHPQSAYYLYANANKIQVDNTYRYYGFPVRAVKDVY